MKQCWFVRSTALILTLALAGCAKQPIPGSSSAPSASVDVSLSGENFIPLESSEQAEPLPEVGRRWYPEFTDHLIPCPDYGELVPMRGPYVGAAGRVYPWGDGLMTIDGKVVLDPVLDDVYYCCCTDENGDTIPLPALYLSRYMRADGSEQMEQVALAASDGSWVTGFDYWGCIEFPGGLAVGDHDRMSILDPETGETLRSWTWEALGLQGPEEVYWVTGDAYVTAQWALGALYLGDGSQGHVRLLNPETGAITEVEAQKLIDYFDRIYNTLGHGLTEARIMEDGSSVLTYRGKEYRFPSSLPRNDYPWITTTGQVLFNSKDGQCAVTTLDGQIILPVQPGEAEELPALDGGNLLGILNDEGWQIYDREGTLLSRLPGGEMSRADIVGPLVEITEDNCASYYRPETGECVFRTYWAEEN